MLVEDFLETLRVDGHQLKVVQHFDHRWNDLGFEELAGFAQVLDIFVALERPLVFLLEAKLQSLELFHRVCK